MKVLTLRQPYASLVAAGIKTIETRSWRAPQSLIGQRIAIHAAAQRPRDHWVSFQRDPEFPAPFAALYDYGRCVDPWESNDGEWWCYRWAGPLGAIVATARLVECLPIIGEDEVFARADRSEDRFVTDSSTWAMYEDSGFGSLRIINTRTIHSSKINDVLVISDQAPYGDFRPGRWAWFLDDVERLAVPVPFKGGQGLSRSWTLGGAAANADLSHPPTTRRNP